MGWLDSDAARLRSVAVGSVTAEEEPELEYDDSDFERDGHTWTTLFSLEQADGGGWVAVVWRFGVLGSSPELVREMFFGNPCRVRRLGRLAWGRSIF